MVLILKNNTQINSEFEKIDEKYISFTIDEMPPIPKSKEKHFYNLVIDHKNKSVYYEEFAKKELTETPTLEEEVKLLKEENLTQTEILVEVDFRLSNMELEE